MERTQVIIDDNKRAITIRTTTGTFTQSGVSKPIIDYITTLQEENERLNNIINTILDFNFFKEECPLNFGYQEECDEEKAQEVFYEDDYCEENCNDDYKKCWLKYFERLQELKENK